MNRKEMPIYEIKTKTNTIYLLGTAHVSEQSVQDVITAIDEIKPDRVAVELDEAREKKLTKKDQNWQDLNMFKVIKQKKALFLLASVVLSSFQRRLGNDLSVAPGAEMLAAINESKKRNIPVVLADRSAEITLKRAWNKSSFWGRQKIIATLISVVFTREKISEIELEELKQKSTQGKMMEELAMFLPKLKQVLVDERDEYLSMNIMSAKGDKVLAILGAAHVPGIIARIEAEVNEESGQKSDETETQILSSGSIATDSKSIDATGIVQEEVINVPFTNSSVDKHDNKNASKEVGAIASITVNTESEISTDTIKSEKILAKLQELEIIPEKRNLHIVGYLVPLLVLGLFAYGFYRGGIASVSQNFMRWWIINGGLSFLGALIALAHPITIVLSFLAAPLTSLNPFIGVGLLTGLCETYFRAPRVRDFEDLQTLSLSVKALYKNRITRILLVLVTTTIGSAIGTFLGLSIIASNV